MKLLFATGNAGKLREACQILDANFQVLSPSALGLDGDVPETGNTFQENSLIKAQHLFDACRKVNTSNEVGSSLSGQAALFNGSALAFFSDDSGLEVDALGGAPGIYSARYASDHNFDDNISRLFFELNRLFPPNLTCAVPTHNPAPRFTEADFYPGAARFRCVVTLILPDGIPHFFDGSVEGRILRYRCGECGFGYDPVFVPNAYPQNTMAELSDAQKNSISHRGVALRAMADWLSIQKLT